MLRYAQHDKRRTQHGNLENISESYFLIEYTVFKEKEKNY